MDEINKSLVKGDKKAGILQGGNTFKYNQSVNIPQRFRGAM